MINYDLTRIKALAFDVDGVLSLSTIPLIGVDGVPHRTVNIKDGYALQLAVKKGLQIAIITGGNTISVTKRYKALGVQNVFCGVVDKLPCFKAWMEKLGLKKEEILYMGDDIPDLEVIQYCNCSCAPADAVPEIITNATYISPYIGGQGCVRDVLEQVLKAQSLWMNETKAFGW